MSMTKAQKVYFERLARERNRLVAEVEGLKHKIEAFDSAIEMILRDADGNVAIPESKTRGAAKTILLDLLKEVGVAGLNASTAVEMAARRGQKLARGTAASNLSRMKKDEIVVHDGDRYKLPEFARQRILSVVPLKSS